MQYIAMLIIKKENKIYAEFNNQNNKYYFPCYQIPSKVIDKTFIPSGLNLNFLQPSYKISYPYDDIIINDYTFTIIEIDLKYNPNKLKENIAFKWIPYYYLNKNYFDNTSKLFINIHNSFNPINDIPLDARILFSKAYIENDIDMYEYIQKFTTYCINNKNMLDIYNTDIFIQIFSKDRYYDKFFKANKDICIEAARTYFEYHNTFIE